MKKFLIACGVGVLMMGNVSFAQKKASAHEGLIPLQLKCEFKNSPLGIDKLHPRLSWVLEAALSERDQYQTAYRIQVASSLALLKSGKANLWDSHKQYSKRNNNIHYEGKNLHSGMACYWRVKVWDRNKTASGWSVPSCWTMGLLSLNDWKGRWIQDSEPYPSVDSLMYGDLSAPVFRKEFITTKRIKRATLYVSGLGYYIAFINGKRVGNHVLDPGWTDYAKTIYYSTYDVTKLLSGDKNCIGIMLGNGWYNPLPMLMWGRLNLRKVLTSGQPKFTLQLNIIYADGTSKQVASNQSWKVTDGPVIRNNIYLGVKYDDRKQLSGWDRTGYDDAGWRQVVVSKNIPTGKLQSQPQPPIVIADTLTPKSIKRITEGKYIVDFGRNFGGIIRLKAKGKSGTVIRVRYGELLYPDGSLNVMTSVAGQIKHKGLGGSGAPDTAYARDTFILNGKGEEIFQPTFTFHGFRYAEISGYPGILKPKNIVGLVMHANVPDAGNFECSDTLINKIQQACRNTFLSNLFSVQSDCPHRERFGYGGDMLATCNAFMDNFNMSTFYAKSVNDYVNAALPEGGLTETAPFVGIADAGLSKKSGPIEWGSVLPVLLYRLYRYYGNIDLIRQHYSTAKKWVDFLSWHAKGDTLNKTLGDWESIDPKDIAESATAFYYYNASLIAFFAKLLHKKNDFQKYSRLVESIKKAFIKKFVNTTTGDVGLHTEATQAYALYFGLIPDTVKKMALKVLLHDIKDIHHDHISTGMFGTKFIMQVLSDNGYSNVAYKMVNQKTFPGWGYMISHGATTIWEHWAFSNNTYSHNHPMFGSVSQWFYEHLAGIQPDTDAIDYNKIIIRPDIISGLSWAKASYHSINGLIQSSWKKKNDQFNLDVIIPVNTTAKIFIPSKKPSKITEGGANINDVSRIKFIGHKGSYNIYQIGSGHYHFVSYPF